MDPDLPFQSMTPRRALSLLKEIRLELVSAAITASSSSAGEAPSRPPSRPRCSGPSKSTPRPGTRPQSPEQGIYLTRSGNTFPARCHLPGITRKSRQTPARVHGVMKHEPYEVVGRWNRKRDDGGDSEAWVDGGHVASSLTTQENQCPITNHSI
jgi:hypothetical protein